MAIFTAALAFFLQADGGAGTGAPASQGFGALAGMMSNIGPVAIFVLVLLLLASLYSWMVILGKISTFSKATDAEPEIHSRVSQGDAAAGDCGVDRRLQREPAGAGI